MPRAGKIGYYNLNKRFNVKSTSTLDSYTYTADAASNLAMWTRMMSTGPVDKGPNSLSPAYENTPNFSEVQLGNKTYPAAQFNDTGEDSASVTSTSGLLSFSSLATGGTPTATSDKPFSISLWANLDHTTSIQYLFGKKGNSGSSPREYGAWINTGGAISFKLEDETASNASVQITALSDNVKANTWHHIVLTYDGRGTIHAIWGMKMYLDGQAITTNPSTYNTYVGMQPDHNQPLYIGGQHDDSDELDGSMSEFAVWSKELSATEVAAVYYSTTQGMGLDNQSGYLNNPARIMLQERDNHTGSYPTVARTGDPDFMGNKKVFFDDTKTVEFFSSYATGEIKFTDIPKDANALMLTGSDGDKKTFEFQKGVIQSFAGSEIIDIKNLKDLTTKTVAYKFAQAVNNASFGILATNKGNTVSLRQHKPVVGTYKLGNLIQTSSYYNSIVPVAIKQFVQNGPENYLYPFLLDKSSPHISKRVATPNTTGSLLAPAIMGSGISDVEIGFTPGESLTAFNESRIYIDNDDPFYQESIPQNVLPGFNQRLGSKIAIEIDISPTESTNVFFSTGTYPHSAPYTSSAQGLAMGINSGLAYFNFTDKKWEIIGDLTTGSNVDYLNSNRSIRESSMLSVIGSQYYAYDIHQISPGVYPPLHPMAQSLGVPSDYSGFPFAKKFNASTGSLLNVASHITSPLLVENVALTLSCSIGTYPLSGSAEEVYNSTFFVVLQRGTTFSRQATTKIPIRMEADRWIYKEVSFEQTHENEIIWHGRVGRFDSRAYRTEQDIVTKKPNLHKACDVWIKADSITDRSSGSISVKGPCNIGHVVDAASLIKYARDLGGQMLTGNQRARQQLSSGRSFIKAVAGSKIKESLILEGVPHTVLDIDSKISPFILFPGDRLFLAHACQPAPLAGLDATIQWQNRSWTEFDTEHYNEHGVANHYYNTLLPGEAKLTLFGSHIRNGLPVESSLNQPLTSDAIHEDIRDDTSPYGEARCLDQWMVEPETSYRGGYLDNIITGSMYAKGESDPGKFKNPFESSTRKVQTSVVDGHAGVTGSLQRFSRAIDNNKTVYDSHMPNPIEFSKIDKFKMLSYGPKALGFGTIFLGNEAAAIHHEAVSGVPNQVNTVWPKAFPFEPKYSSLNRKLTTQLKTEKYNVGSAGLVSTLTSVAWITGSRYYTPSDPYSSVKFKDPYERSFSSVLRTFFGFGDGLGGNSDTGMYPSFENPQSSGIYYSKSGRLIIRGFKYGIYSAVPTSPTSVFRPDTFGQFRDMLEQGIHTRFFDNGKLDIEAPVQVRFRSRAGELVNPESTNSQNLNTFVTSSVPYFDGASRDRTSLQPDLEQQVSVDLGL